MEEKTPPRVSLRQIEGFQFEVRFGEGMSPLLTDEQPPLGKGTGPAPTHLLLAAVGNCMASSLYFALTKFKNDPQGVRAEASAEMGRNEAGRLRVRRIHVRLEIGAPAAALQHLDRILGQFEEFCVVGQSVAAGIPLVLSVFDGEGKQLK